MSAQSTGTAVPIHLRVDDYHLLGPEDLGAEGLRVREAVGPFTSIAAVGPLVVVHDRYFAPGAISNSQPHRGVEQLFYVLEGSLRHTDTVDRMSGTIRAGDLGILTEGREGMGHVERNDADVPARVYVLAYPADPMPDEATFRVVEGTTMPRLAPHAGVETKVLVERDSKQVHGQIHEIADTRFEVGGALPIVLEPGQAALLYCIEGRIQVTSADGGPTTSIGVDGTVLFAPAPETRRVLVDAQGLGRVLHAVTGTGFGFRLQDPGS
jgi:redox-sensitive bicupin YhaK (pirin superfamily)